ncbi:hypothetical protein FisN_24Hh121 [Fistulifera solaris]|uniref:Uncharacterized protein n=1 Tax=Fistulifera solaris TaxID=1519565 RepID=A0A1Z5JEV9_FISSO|nr:hypothetical protein FisN_24Hh121 [Fistulifera solaris]|eukprot:GAX12545.1 hypothetical protein FisN_24Hh121 [Fistulifera solaris]
MKQCGLLLSMAVTTLPSLANAASSTGTSFLQVHIPQKLSKPDGYDHRDALFGIPPYGGSIAQQVYYADADLCSPQVDKRRGYPERNRDSNGNQEPWPAPFILMIDRGNCDFVEKVRNAQRAGASAVLIADTSCRCADDICMNETGDVTCEATEPYMADDGSGTDVSIPSFLVFKHDADTLRQVLISNTPIQIEMRFSIPAPDNRVEYDLWSTPRNLVAQEFITDFEPAALALGATAKFTPHMYVLDGVRSGCRGPNGEDQCFNLCTNNGRYCSTDPDDDLYAGASGADVVAESLRSLCIWQIYSQIDGIGAKWWKYVNEFRDMCIPDVTNDENYNSAECVHGAMATAGVDRAKVEKCMADSGGLEGDVENTIFEQQMSDRDAANVVLIPSFFVNQAPVRGELGFSTAFKAICAGFAAGTRPEICVTCANCANEKLCVQKGKCEAPNGSAGQISLGMFVLSLLGLSLVFSTVGYILHQRQQAHMRQQIRGIVQEYMPVGMDRNGEIIDNSLALDEEDDGPQFTIS